MFKKNIYRIISLTFTLAFLIAIQQSDSLYIPYLIVGVTSIVFLFNRPNIFQQKPKHFCWAIIFSVLLSFFVCASNYHLFVSFETCNTLASIMTYLALTIGSLITFFNIFYAIPFYIKRINLTTSQNQTSFYKLSPYKVFLISFLIISAIYLLIFFICKYPGNLSFDSLNQIQQSITGDYSNHHPFIHTIIIGFFVNIGQNLFQNINAGVALYSCFQILLMSAIFAYTLSTLYRQKCKKSIFITILIIYALIPYHIMYSMTVWKDVVFAGALLSFIVSQYRIFSNLGSKYLNYTILLLSYIGTCLLKGNGIIIMLLFILFFFILMFKDIKKNTPNFLLLVGTFICCFVFNQLLPSFGVAKTELMESLSVPAQQIARTIKEAPDTLSSSQVELLKKVSDLDAVPNSYNPHISDPIKEQVWRSSSGEKYISEHKTDFIKLYLEIGISHPRQYFTAWVDQTKGYFNGGYNYWVISNDITENNLGVQKSYENNIPNKIFNQYLTLFENNQFFRIIYCIGFMVWLSIAIFYISIIKKNLHIILLTMMPLLLIFTLLIAAPVYSEFRYAYPVFCCAPFLFFIAVNSKNQKSLN